MARGKDSIYCRYIKRLLDIICALMAIVLLCWLYALVAVLVKINLGSPVIFKQKRVGKDEKYFELCKFRTMSDKRDDNGNLCSDDDRLTRFGRWLRSTSLDELPEVWNIIRGDMSVIGPRPLLVEYLPYYTKQEHHRHDVRPGLSGWAQVNGRNTLSWEEKFAYDLEYIEKCSFLLDSRIAFKTISKIVQRSDILIGKQFKVRRLDLERKQKVRVLFSYEHNNQEV